MFTDNVVRSLSCKARANAMQYVTLSDIVSCSALYFPLSAGFLRMPSCAESLCLYLVSAVQQALYGKPSAPQSCALYRLKAGVRRPSYTLLTTAIQRV